MRRSGSRWADLGAALAQVERWLLPGECLLCRRSLAAADGDALACGVCRSRWRPVPEPVCERCGQPVDRDTACRNCAHWPPGLVRSRSAVWLDEGARRAVHCFKYEGWWRLADDLARAMRPLDLGSPDTVLVPVPLGAARQRTRGYNQGERLAAGLARQRGYPLRADLLRRHRETATQTRLTPEARAANVRGAFEAVGPCPARVVLVDDVFTTGATLVAAARALLAAGAASVAAVTFARAELPLAATSRALELTPGRPES